MIKVTVNYSGRCAEFWMPCSESEMHQCFEQLQALEEHSTSLFIQAVIRPAELAFIEDTFVDMDELNFLAKRLNCFSDTELDTFYGMIRHKGFTQMKDLINATYNLDNYTLVQDFRHIAFVGRTHYHALHGRITEAAEKATDFAKMGRDLLTSGNGIITDYGMLFPNEGKVFDEVYDGQVFPVQYHDDDSLVDVCMDYGGKTEVVFLPNHPIAITKALRRLGADSIGDCGLSLYDFSVDNPQWCERFREMISNEDIFGINSLAAAINAADIDLNKLWSLAEYAQVEDAVELAQLAQHIDYFTFIEGAEDYEAVGQYLTENCDDYQLNPTLREFFDFEALGEHFADINEGRFVCEGFIYNNSDMPLREILSQNDTMQMGGM